MLTRTEIKARRLRNERFALVEAPGLKPDDFEWIGETVLRHRLFRDYYDFHTNRHSHPGENDKKCPDEGVFDPSLTPIDSSFEQWLKGMKKWLEDVEGHQSTPDLWATIGQEKVLSTAAASRDIDN